MYLNLHQTFLTSGIARTKTKFENKSANEKQPMCDTDVMA